MEQMFFKVYFLVTVACVFSCSAAGILGISTHESLQKYMGQFSRPRGTSAAVIPEKRCNDETEYVSACIQRRSFIMVNIIITAC